MICWIPYTFFFKMADDLLKLVFYKLIFSSTVNILYIFRAINTIVI